MHLMPLNITAYYKLLNWDLPTEELLSQAPTKADDNKVFEGNFKECRNR